MCSRGQYGRRRRPHEQRHRAELNAPEVMLTESYRLHFEGFLVDHFAGWVGGPGSRDAEWVLRGRVTYWRS